MGRRPVIFASHFLAVWFHGKRKAWKVAIPAAYSRDAVQSWLDASQSAGQLPGMPLVSLKTWSFSAVIHVQNRLSTPGLLVGSFHALASYGAMILEDNRTFPQI